jgi:beta-carotene ketolase (CrtW type)
MRQIATDKTSVIGVASAVVVISAWTAHLAWILGWDVPATSPVWLGAAVLIQTFLHTGLFITGHDAMHGTVCPANRRINDAIGWLVIKLYALFDYDVLKEKHWEHHADPVSDDDPDFHDGGQDRFWPWYVGFLREYMGVWQFVGMAIAFNVLHHLVGVSLWNLNLLWVAPSLLSTLQLFYFGTYLPHRRPASGFKDGHHATSNAFAPWLSFLTCYHFGYHWEHHAHPETPWWRLPQRREERAH